MPKLWNQTIVEHRRDVRAAILGATWELVAEHGLTSVKMSHIAERAGIGRPTLYKYFPDVEAILLAWHQQHVEEQLDELIRIRDRAGQPLERVRGVLGQYAAIAYRRGLHATDLMALLHRDQHATSAEQQVFQVLRDVIAAAAEVGLVRGDVSPDELARYTLHALTAASTLPSKAAVERLVDVTLGGLRAPG
jgi:AcrR family transcriptional regulator